MKLKRRKNFFPTLIMAFLFWGGLGFLVLNYPPASNLTMVLFFGLLFTAGFLTLAIFFGNSKNGFLVASFLTLFFVFRFLGIGNPLNLLILLAIFMTLAIYLR